ncbi:MAG: tRNA threonylcarbamoyladenosine dehydratase, partial [Muribaculaceae bacterium]|nr:tRNA threonylcarbamoyladenosine dehydratase [Muribaculaceae bacterium]MBQ1797917.1 tRNA threonylcarbamoyladenosine dehydratase [Muribaculaceae bacterium]
ELIRRCHRMNIPIIVCMGAANKVDPSSFTVADITNTRICPLAKVLRKHLRREGITHFKCVYSPEMPLEPIIDPSDEVESKGATGRPAPASNAFVPAAAGILVGATVVKDLIATDGDH